MIASVILGTEEQTLVDLHYFRDAELIKTS
jgi:hypothetical protein